MGQIFNHPVYALGVGDADGNTVISAQFGRGLNSDSGEGNSVVANFIRSMEKVSFGIGGGYFASNVEELMLHGRVGVNLINDAGTPVTVGIQSGIGWMSQDVGTESQTLLHFPIGVGIRGRGSDSGTSVVPFVMPRVSISRSGAVGAVASSTDTNFGASGGASVTTEAGFGIHAAVDWVAAGNSVNPFLLGVGVHYRLP